MRIDILTLFPTFFDSPLELSILKRARDKGLVSIYRHDIRAAATDRHRSVDDTPYGGGPGMVLRVDVLKRALDQVVMNGPTDIKPHVILMTPQGARYKQPLARQLARREWIILIAGHYEGFDERFRRYVDAEISIGDYVLSGGEPAALVVADSIVRLLPGAVGDEQSPDEESFELIDENGQPLIEYPHYTRPEEFNGERVPEILLSGNHAAIRHWRLEQAKLKTAKRNENT